MVKKQVITLNVWIFLTFVVMNVLQGAQGFDAGDRALLDILAQHAGRNRPKREMMPFAVDEDKLGFCFAGKNFDKQNKKLLQILFRRPSIKFDEVEHYAAAIYGNGDVGILWGRVLEAMRQAMLLDIDYAGKCFVTCAEPRQTESPNERIEKAIYRICRDEPGVIKRNLVLRLYRDGYRDYAYRSIVAKRSALVCAGFCPKRAVGANYDRLQDHWKKIKRGTEKDMKAAFCECEARDVDVVYQMVYMRKHAITEILGEYVEKDNGDVSRDVLERQSEILRYLQERADQPCSLMHIAEQLGSEDRSPSGVVYDIAHLVFCGKAVVSCDSENQTCTLLSQGEIPARRKEICDELVFFQNMRTMPVEDAILHTYCQGYRAYPPSKMILFKNGFDLMNFDGRISWYGCDALTAFLQKNKNVPPLWRWDADMEEQAGDFKKMFYERTLDAVFEMHNRGTLDIVRLYTQIHPIGAQQKFVMGDVLSVTKKRLCEKEHCCLKELSLLLIETNGALWKKEGVWDTVLDAVSGFIKHVHYDIEQDKFTWIETPEPLEDATEEAAAKEACVLRNRYPCMGVQCLTFILLHKGFALSAEKIYFIFHGLDVAELVLSEQRKCSPCALRCKQIFAFLRGEKSDFTDDVQVQDAYDRNCRLEHIVNNAKRFSNNNELRDIAESTKFVQRGGRGAYKRPGAQKPPAASKKAKRSKGVDTVRKGRRVKRAQTADVSPLQTDPGSVLQEETPLPSADKDTSVAGSTPLELLLRAASQKYREEKALEKSLKSGLPME